MLSLRREKKLREKITLEKVMKNEKHDWFGSVFNVDSRYRRTKTSDRDRGEGIPDSRAEG